MSNFQSFPYEKHLNFRQNFKKNAYNTYIRLCIDPVILLTSKSQDIDSLKKSKKTLNFVTIVTISDCIFRCNLGMCHNLENKLLAILMLYFTNYLVLEH